MTSLNGHLAFLMVSTALLLIFAIDLWRSVRKLGKPVRSADIRLLVRRWLCAAGLLVPIILARLALIDYANRMGDSFYSLVLVQHLLGEWLAITLLVLLAFVMSFAMFGVALAQSVFLISTRLGHPVSQGENHG